MMNEWESRQLERAIERAVYAALERQRIEKAERRRAAEQRHIEQTLKATEVWIMEKVNES